MLGSGVQLLATVERRLELLAALGIEDVLLIEFTPALAALEPERFAADYLQAIGAELVVAADSFRFGHERRGDLALLERLGLRTATAPHLAGVSSSRIRSLVDEGRVAEAAALLGAPGGGRRDRRQR